LFPQLSMWEMACGIAWAEPELQVHYLFIHISLTSPHSYLFEENSCCNPQQIS
jgi:hypothetical protein